MRLRRLLLLFGFVYALPLAAQEVPSAFFATLRFRTATLSRDVRLRDSGPAASVRKTSLPPGGQELKLQPATSTPYDRYFGSVRAVMANLESQPATMAEACHLMKVGYSFRYVTRDPYRPDPPKLTEAQRAGDCKSKALWLFESLGETGALFVIGKAERRSLTSHAWVYWRHAGRWWILDCTERIDLIAADSVSSERYIPYYSFAKNGTYRHPTTRVESVTDSSIAAAAVGAPERRKVR